MSEQENIFYDLYKEVDQLLIKRLNSKTGIKEYINRMRNNEYGFKHIPYWKKDFYALKRLKNIRNYLSHESGRSELTEDDIKYLKRFKKQIINITDPLSEYLSIKKEQRKKTRIISIVLITILIILAILVIAVNKRK